MKKIIFIMMLLVIIPIWAQFNQSRKQEPKTEKKVFKVEFIQRLNAKISQIQFEFRNKMSHLSQEIKKEKDLSLILTVLFFAFLYGILHSAGPGHGKVITSSYFLSENAKVTKGILAGFGFGLLHALSGLMLVIFLQVIMNNLRLQQTAMISDNIQRISFFLIIILGIYLMQKHIRNLRSETYSEENHSLWAMIISLGLIPCPGSIIIVLFSINIGVLWLGVLMVMTMALGMGLTISLVGIITIVLRKYSIKLIGISDVKKSNISASIGILGSIIMILFGLIFVI